MAYGVQRALDLAGSPTAPVRNSARRTLEVNDLRQAEAWRAQGRGWQTIATCLRVNETDLRMALGDIAAPPKPALGGAVADGDGARTKAPPERKLTIKSKILLAVAEGADNLIEVVVGTKASTNTVKVLGGRMRGEGLLAPKAWTLTEAGRRKVAQLRRAALAVDLEDGE